MYQALTLDGGARALQTQNHIKMGNLTVFTEQDFLNVFLKGRIHYITCGKETGGRGNGTIVHTKGVEASYKKLTGQLPEVLSLYMLPQNGSAKQAVSHKARKLSKHRAHR